MTPFIPSGTEQIFGQPIKSVAALADGTFLVLWVHEANYKSTGYGQIFNADGSVKTQPFTVTETRNAHIPTLKASTLSDGRFAITWNDAGTDEVYARIYDVDAHLITNTIVVETNMQGQSTHDPSITALADGGFVITTAFGYGSHNTHVFVDAQGNRSPRVTVEKAERAIAEALPDGNYVSVASIPTKGPLGDTIAWSLVAYIRKPNGEEVLQKTLVTGTYSLAHSVTVLSNGRFVVTWSESTGQGNILKA